MSQILNYSPGQQATIVFETVSSDGYRYDGYAIPSITRIIFPNLYLAQSYPQLMSRLDVGLYIFQFTIPTEAFAVGSYIVDVLYYSEVANPSSTFFQVVVSSPFGQYSVSTI
jgi:hypothetical protein